MGNIFVTFTIPYIHQDDEKFAVRCKNMEQAMEVARDAYSLEGIKNIRLRRCGKPGNRNILEYKNYWVHNWY